MRLRHLTEFGVAVEGLSGILCEFCNPPEMVLQRERDMIVTEQSEIYSVKPGRL